MGLSSRHRPLVLHALRRRSVLLSLPDSPARISRYERCVGLTWCTHCRVYSAALIHVPHTTHLDDESMPPARPGQDERPGASEVQVLDHVDRLLSGP
ncbi:hypothetical protein SRIMM317S_02282 [Streptomyces rimosus subsp. rimosus]